MWHPNVQNLSNKSECVKELLVGSTPVGSARKRFFLFNCYDSGSDGSAWQNNDGFLEISEASIHPRPPQSEKVKRQINICWGDSVFIKSVMFRVQRVPFDKITIDFCRSRKRLHDSDLPGLKNTKSDKNLDQNSKIQFLIEFLVDTISSPLNLFS